MTKILFAFFKSLPVFTENDLFLFINKQPQKTNKRKQNGKARPEIPSYFFGIIQGVSTEPVKIRFPLS